MPVTAAGRVAIALTSYWTGVWPFFHEEERWLAVADLHFGYELSQRAAGRLIPLWGMTSIEERLSELLDDYQPRRLLIVGDLVHNQASAAAAFGSAHPVAEALRGDCAGRESRSSRCAYDRVGTALGDTGFRFSARALRFG
jgi:hypothetical protein